MQFEICPQNNDMLGTTRGLWMVSEAPSIYPMHLRKVMKHLSSNGCASSQYITPQLQFREGSYKRGYFVCHLSVNPIVEMTWCQP